MKLARPSSLFKVRLALVIAGLVVLALAMRLYFGDCQNRHLGLDWGVYIVGLLMIAVGLSLKTRLRRGLLMALSAFGLGLGLGYYIVANSVAYTCDTPDYNQQALD